MNFGCAIIVYDILALIILFIVIGSIPKVVE
jgi:hypothetical protein